MEGQREGVGAVFAVSWRCQLVWGSLKDYLEEPKPLCLLGAPLLWLLERAKHPKVADRPPKVGVREVRYGTLW